jgi:cytochrome b6-f complex iron-sulfur subunit
MVFLRSFAAWPLQRGCRMDTPNPSRREFCAHAVSFVAVGALLESCGGSPTSPSNIPALSTISAGVVSNTITLTVDSASPLSAVGSAALVQTSAGNFLVARTAQDTFNAMTAICTHEACTVERYQSGTFTCPCHGSQYSATGAVVRGPASASLRRFNAAFANNQLTISLA